ncbi:hypothetical protein HMF8227_00696 [Saliniradius amylolyticus]|uniref:Methyltransferase n=1 Tax=Saliniradius amylolyticus TaxID=2183582 RepID=A0A2S2E0Y2_9ALTE|nr:class I SAM-dependent methyltransferase [Saliniradius amylolyticus]AWL11192.1 hypothetical protein HMF8227_00696 [Saliniradius amylolyticus]
MKSLATIGLTLGLLVNPLANAHESPLHNAINGEHRTPAYTQRDEYRHPEQTLEFFGVKPDMTVVEIWPGGGGWYTEILAPYLKDNGKLYAAQFDPNSDVDYFVRNYKKFMQKLDANPEVYGDVEVTTFAPPEKLAIAPEGSADRVLTFRNVHNWYMNGRGEETLLAAFSAFYDALKPGGVLGVVDHRLPDGRTLDAQDKSGYMKQDYVIDIAQKAGFKLAATSEINANPKDSADHPRGVWTLPPSLRLGEQDKNKYLAIGESDRMTLKFVKPAAQ